MARDLPKTLWDRPTRGVIRDAHHPLPARPDPEPHDRLTRLLASYFFFNFFFIACSINTQKKTKT